MIYEMRTDTFAQNNDAVDFVQKLGEVIEHRNTFSPLGALWLSEIGTLNQVIHVWPYEDLQHRNEVRAAVAKDGNWPPPGIAGLLGEDVEILNPVPFMRPWEGVQDLGSFYEVRSYVCKPGSISDMVRLWGECMPAREKYSPLAACWYTEFGTQFKWISVWPYATLDERARLRAEASKNGAWPPATGHLMMRQENRIMTPAPFSPLR